MSHNLLESRSDEDIKDFAYKLKSKLTTKNIENLKHSDLLNLFAEIDGHRTWKSRPSSVKLGLYDSTKEESTLTGMEMVMECQNEIARLIRKKDSVEYKNFEYTESQSDDIKEKRKIVSDIASYLVYNSFRNGPLEDIHAGEIIDIPKNASRISDAEMEYIMRTATTSVAMLLEQCLINPKSSINPKEVLASHPPKYWGNPDWRFITYLKNNL